MKRIISVLITVLALMLLFAACSDESAQTEATASPTATVETAQETVDPNVVAVVNGIPVYKEDYNDAYAYYVSYYSYMYGEDLADYEGEISDAAMKGAVDEKLYISNLEKLGYLDYSDEQIAAAEAKTQEDIENYIDQNYGDEIKTALGEGYTEEQYKEAMVDYEDDVLTNVFNMTREEVVDYYLLSGARERAYTEVEASAAPTQEEVSAYFEENLAAYKDKVSADPSTYISDVNAGSTAYYAPAGVRKVRQILIKIDEDMSAAIALLRNGGYDDAADILLEKSLKDIEDEAKDILSKINKGTITFSEAIEQYNEDTGMPEDGYPVAANVSNYVTSFTEESMGLGEIGDITGLVASDYGYHIIEYYADVEEGEMSLDDLYDDLFAELSSTSGSEAWSELVAQWEAEADIVYYNENL